MLCRAFVLLGNIDQVGVFSRLSTSCEILTRLLTSVFPDRLVIVKRCHVQRRHMASRYLSSKSTAVR